MRHEAGVVDHDVDASELFDGSIYKFTDLFPFGHIGCKREDFAAALGQFFGDCVEAIRSPRAEHDGACYHEKSLPLTDKPAPARQVRAPLGYLPQPKHSCNKYV